MYVARPLLYLWDFTLVENVPYLMGDMQERGRINPKNRVEHA